MCIHHIIFVPLKMTVDFMSPLHSVHENIAYKDGYACLSVFFMSRIARQNLIKFDMKFIPLKVTPHLYL